MLISEVNLGNSEVALDFHHQFSDSGQLFLLSRPREIVVGQLLGFLIRGLKIWLYDKIFLYVVS